MFQKHSIAYYEHRKSELEKRKQIFDKKSEIRDLRKQMRWFQKPTTTKLIVAWLFINCTVVEIYSMVMMYHFENLDALYSLIAAVVTETVSFAVYAAKAYNETKQEELIKLKRDQMEVLVPEEELEESEAAG